MKIITRSTDRNLCAKAGIVLTNIRLPDNLRQLNECFYVCF